MRKLAFIGIIFVLLAVCCQDAGRDVIRGNGLIFIGVEGCYYIEAASGEHYEIRITTLPSEYQQDSIRVHYVAAISESQNSFCQHGTLIEILEIRRL